MPRPVKDPSQFRIIGKTTPQRPEIAQIVIGKLEYTQDVRVPGMLHARSVRPPVAGSTLVRVDGFDGGNPPGLVKVLSKGNYVAVVAKTEWQAIQAAHALKVTWKKPATPVFPNGYEAMYDYLAKTPPQAVATPAQRRRRRGGTRIGRADHHRDLPVRLSVARLDDPRLLCCRGEGRRRDGLVWRTETIPRAECGCRLCSAFRSARCG